TANILLPCAGYNQILLIESDGTQRLLITLDYHYQPTFQTWNCGLTLQPTPISSIVVNPIYDQVVIALDDSSFLCPKTNLWGILLNYSDQQVTKLDIPIAHSFSWSPDGKHLAYVDLTDCLTRTDPFDRCSGNIRLRSAESDAELNAITQASEDTVHSYGM